MGADIYIGPEVSVAESEVLEVVCTSSGNEELRRVFADAGYMLEDYDELEFSYTPYAFWNSTVSSTLCTSANTSASNFDQFTATGMMTKTDLPDGTVIVLKSGYQYRPEGWVSLSQKNSSSTRPATVTAQIVTVTSAWWGRFTARAFNLAFKGNPSLSEDQMKTLPQCIAFFVPKKTATKLNRVADKQIFTMSGLPAGTHIAVNPASSIDEENSATTSPFIFLK